MYDRLGRVTFDDDGMMRRGLIVRHLVLPSRRHDSIRLISALADSVEPRGLLLSLMSQYTPEFYDGEDKGLRRRLTVFEYESVLRVANERGFEGFMQSPSSASAKYTPPFEDSFTMEI
jgi:putative pyruvate formate lyase activating enzyme